MREFGTFGRDGVHADACAKERGAFGDDLLPGKIARAHEPQNVRLSYSR